MIPETELARLESARARTLDLVEGLSQQELDRVPVQDRWSVGEVLDHLLKAEEANREVISELIALARSGRRPYLWRDLTTAGLSPALVPRSLLPLLSIPSTLASLFMPFSVREAMVRNRLFAASTSDELRPRRGKPADELRQELRRSLDETRRLLEQNADLDFCRMTYQHPLLGANDVPQILRLTAAHEERHQDQICEILGRDRRPERPDRPPGPAPNPGEPDGRIDSGRLSTGRIVVLGEGLAAGMADFGLKADLQRESFPAQMARQMRAGLRLPLIQPPGLGDLPGLPRLPVRVPAMMQDTVREDLSEAAMLAIPQNLSVPGLHLADALELRPAQPIVHRGDAKRTALNLVLGVPGLIEGKTELPTQLEAALGQQPTLALVELGYAEAIEASAAAVAGEPERLPSADAFRKDATRLVAALRKSGAEVVVLTVPDPLDTAHLSTLDAAARVLRVTAPALSTAYGLAAGDRVTLQGLVEIGNQILAGVVRPLPSSCLLREPQARAISARVDEMNYALGAAAGEHGALVFDLHALIRRVREGGIATGVRHLTADFLGGFYSLNGWFPGRTGHAVIASELLRLLERVYGARFGRIDVDGVAASDPVVSYRPPEGPVRSELPLASMAAEVPKRPPKRGTAKVNGGKDWPPPPPRPGRLQLPPGLEQTLPLSRRASYHGDAIRIVDCADEKAAQYGSCGDLFFGGLILYDSHLSGNVHLRFSPPVGDVTRFQISLGEGLAGDDGVLSAPQLFRWPVLQARVSDDSSMVSSGELNLATGEVSNLQVFVQFRNSALFGLVRVNPNFPTQPITFPGQYGSAWARFDPRPDGRLDFTFYGSTFLPLGSRLGNDPVAWALPFSSPAADFASIPASGMAMHPHMQLSTREPDETEEAGELLDVPFNSVQELTLFTHNSSFGDQFTLNTDTLGGYAKGRSHVMGRLEVQFGERFGDSVSVAVSSLSPGGLLADTVPQPLAAVFPGRLYPGPIGHDEFLRFPLRTYFLDAVNFLDDPFDLAVGAVDLRTGDFLNEVLRRGLIGQDVFFALVRVEPRTPQSSFFFRGPARLERGARGEPVFRLKAEVNIPYPPGFLFPAPDLATGFVIGPGSALDPFLWLRAIGDEGDPKAVKRGEAKRVRASTGEEFSYLYSIAADPEREAPFFEYTNHSQQEGTFRLTTLAWASFVHSLGSRPEGGQYDTVTFTGYGTWSLDGGRRPHAVTVQVCTSPETPYVSIQIDGGLVSNVNTKPSDERKALP
ncbi:MAG TPA: DinB family protein [Thermoanaerobaculia bacterium]|nr:DinB family protein [Thermoanaerobaculia bacterium]